ncbi:MAG: 5-carboxymethyl-2-hydroxymuconate Delta-isomerase [Burkholderiaceae bacterium]|nr:MAG: 5-carboxymethyl-2-hydroxymuconate Delta-isomerase [Burkholderiaceae bacterium]
MPHLVILYTANLDRDSDMTALCRGLADTMIEQRDEDGKPVFPIGGTRVLAYPAPHHAVADGGAAGRAAGTHNHGASGDAGDYAFVYLNLRMGQGRSDTIKRRVGDALLIRAKDHFDPIFEKRRLGLTLQIDEGAEVFDAKHSNLHPLFRK